MTHLGKAALSGAAALIISTGVFGAATTAFHHQPVLEPTHVDYAPKDQSRARRIERDGTVVYWDTEN